MRVRLLFIGCPLLLASFGIVRAQVLDLPKDPLRGQALFEEKKCLTCHSINGNGGTEAPDLGKQLYFGSVLELGSVMWNHAPTMNKKFHKANIARPQFTEDEMRDLFGFLYYLRYLGEPGNAARGKKLLRSKGCLSCHRIGGKGGTIGPDLEKLRQYDSPLYLVQAMWNHSAAMHEEIRKSGIQYPMLTGQDVIDIATYVHNAAGGSTTIRMSPGNPFKGRGVLEAKHCNDCHIIDGRGKPIGPSFDKIKLNEDVTGIASKMWNHGPAMMRYMKELSIQWPRFDKSEMADLIAYLYFLGFEDRPGNEQHGEGTFTAKGCINCHRKGGKAPEVTTMKHIGSPIRMIQLMWNHAGEMDDLLIAQNKQLPQLSTTEMRDLYAYLRKVTQK